MSKLMTVLGIILLAAGVALAIMGFFNQAPLLARGIEMGSAINLIIGGILAIGLGGVIGALSGGVSVATEDSATDRSHEAAPAANATAAETTSTEVAAAKSARFPSFSRKVEEASASAAVATTASAGQVVTPAVQETISALEQAKSDLEAAIGGEEDAAAVGDGELYVVEDKVVRGRAARVLSDGTVEAETDEGWMRFENLEHLDEYLDAIEQA